MGKTHAPLSPDLDEFKTVASALTAEVQALREAIDDLRVEIEHAARNCLGEYLSSGKLGAIPESIACANCDCDSPASLAVALQEGWTELSRDDGPSWNYIGVCPDCQEQELADARRVEIQQQQKPLF